MVNQNKEKYSQDTIHFETAICRVLHRRRNIVFSIPGAPNITKNKLVKKKKKKQYETDESKFMVDWFSVRILPTKQNSKIIQDGKEVIINHAR